MSGDRQNREHETQADRPEKLSAHVVLLTSYIPPHQLDNYLAYAQRFERFSVLLSTPMERHREWEVDWGDLDVHVQKNWTLRRRWRHPSGFDDAVDVHLPRDTVSMLRRLKPDLVVSSEFGLRSLLSAFYAMRHAGVHYVLWACVSEHSEQGRGRLRHWLRRWLVKRADGVIVNGASGRRYIQNLGCDQERIHEVPYSSPAATFDQCKLERSPEQSYRLLYVGQLIQRKGVEPFLHCLIQWARANPTRQVEMVVVGDGPLRAKLAALTTPSNLCLKFLGSRNHQQVAQQYATSGILVFPTLADEWGLVVNKALAAGLPVLGSEYGASVGELCREGETGWLFCPDDEQQVLAAIDRAMATLPDRLAAMRSQCRLAVSHITPQTCADRLRKILETVIAGRSAEERDG
ncbi:MAG: glycosyltransferase family 4 protein [Pirellulales bacterium]|nr:glycosyltransferase family 4 protein [Pirellulales bacterium]